MKSKGYGEKKNKVQGWIKVHAKTIKGGWGTAILQRLLLTKKRKEMNEDKVSKGGK